LERCIRRFLTESAVPNNDLFHPLPLAKIFHYIFPVWCETQHGAQLEITLFLNTLKLEASFLSFTQRRFQAHMLLLCLLQWAKAAQFEKHHRASILTKLVSLLQAWVDGTIHRFDFHHAEIIGSENWRRL